MTDLDAWLAAGEDRECYVHRTCVRLIGRMQYQSVFVEQIPFGMTVPASRLVVVPRGTPVSQMVETALSKWRELYEGQP